MIIFGMQSDGIVYYSCHTMITQSGVFELEFDFDFDFEFEFEFEFQRIMITY